VAGVLRGLLGPAAPRIAASSARCSSSGLAQARQPQPPSNRAHHWAVCCTARGLEYGWLPCVRDSTECFTLFPHRSSSSSHVGCQPRPGPGAPLQPRRSPHHHHHHRRPPVPQPAHGRAHQAHQGLRLRWPVGRRDCVQDWQPEARAGLHAVPVQDARRGGDEGRRAAGAARPGEDAQGPHLQAPAPAGGAAVDGVAPAPNRRGHRLPHQQEGVRAARGAVVWVRMGVGVGCSAAMANTTPTQGW